jgi:hypothetical protein
MYDNNLNISLERFFFLMSHDSKDYKSCSLEALTLYKEHYEEILNHFQEQYDKLQLAKTKNQAKGLYTPNFVYSVRGKCSAHLDQINRNWPKN